MEKLDLAATIYETEGEPEAWAVEAVDIEGDGDIYLVIFEGPDALGLAEEYAAAKFTTYRKVA